MNKQVASEDPRVSVEVLKDLPPKFGGMTAVARFLATMNCDGKIIQVGQALLCVPTTASRSQQGFLHLEIDTVAPDMGMVAQAFFESASTEACQLSDHKDLEVVFKYDGNLTEKMMEWIKKYSSDGFYILKATPVPG